LRRELGVDELTVILLFVGRLSSHPNFNQKNAPFAIEIAAGVMHRNPRLHAVFAGKAAEPSALPLMQARIRDLGFASRFHLLGVRQDVPQLMSAADLLLFPSHSEGLGMVAVEAQAAGLRVLASTGVPEEARVVEDMIRFLPLKSGTAAWVDEVQAMLALPQPNLITSNRAVSNSPFSIDRSVDDLMSVYASRSG
jgi:glycosyltransferase involved in cell wall biosynthesis